MFARVGRIIYPPFVRRLDRWWLQRVPMLWRTRLVTALLTLMLLTSVSLLLFPQAVTGFDRPREVDTLGIRDIWQGQIVGAGIALGLWVLMILKRPVGELPLRRHIVTFVAVALGSYLWLVAPSILSFGEIRTIAKLLSSEELEQDDSVLNLYDAWQCIPAGEASNETKKLKDVLERYNQAYVWIELREREKGSCADHDTSSYSGAWISPSIYQTRNRIKVFQDARGFWSNRADKNQFSHIHASFYWFAFAALGIGALTVLLSYPSYVWRRKLLHR